MSERDRPAKNPGGMQCQDCDKIFVGEEWHAFCAICYARRVAESPAKTTGTQHLEGMSRG